MIKEDSLIPDILAFVITFIICLGFGMSVANCLVAAAVAVNVVCFFKLFSLFLNKPVVIDMLDDSKQPKDGVGIYVSNSIKTFLTQSHFRTYDDLLDTLNGNSLYVKNYGDFTLLLGKIKRKNFLKITRTYWVGIKIYENRTGLSGDDVLVVKKYLDSTLKTHTSKSISSFKTEVKDAIDMMAL